MHYQRLDGSALRVVYEADYVAAMATGAAAGEQAAQQQPVDRMATMATGAAAGVGAGSDASFRIFFLGWPR